MADRKISSTAWLLPHLRQLDEARREAVAPVERIEYALHGWVEPLDDGIEVRGGRVELTEATLDGRQAAPGDGIVRARELGAVTLALGKELRAILARPGPSGRPTTPTNNRTNALAPKPDFTECQQEGLASSELRSLGGLGEVALTRRAAGRSAQPAPMCYHVSRRDMARVLLIDDDASLLEVLTLAFEDEGHEVVGSTAGARAIDLVATHRPEVLVCDINMPDLDGFTICKKLREKGEGVPVVLLTSRDSDVDELLGLDLGADDYVTKPFSTRVLCARVGALIRRSGARHQSRAQEPRACAGPLELLPDRMEVFCQGIAVSVTVTEFRLLQCFVERPERVLSRQQLLQWIRQDGSVVADRIVDTYVGRLRKKLIAVDPSFDAIQTVIGAGYRFRVGPG